MNTCVGQSVEKRDKTIRQKFNVLKPYVVNKYLVSDSIILTVKKLQ